MAPQSVTESVSTLPVETVIAEEKVVRRDPIFTRFATPFGLSGETGNILRLGSYHIFALYMCYLNLIGEAPYSTLLVEIFLGYVSGLGITVGCHRYWAHKTFKAKLPLQIILMMMQTMASQYSIYKWSLIHRIHHKYTDTDADPHNSKRGLWYSHMGWLFVPKKKEYEHKLATLEMPDLENDPLVRFQARWYMTLAAIFFFVIPISITYYIFRLPLLYCFASNSRRYIASLHFTWCVNSVAHIWGDRPYDKNITATQNPLVSLIANGEGWHNYHHTFPWDYKASEFGWKINISTMFIDFFAWIGWAYDLKTVSHKMLKARLRRTGDGSHVDADTGYTLGESLGNDVDYVTPADVTEVMKSVEKPVWGWGDETIPEDFRKVTQILRRGGLQ